MRSTSRSVDLCGRISFERRGCGRGAPARLPRALRAIRVDRRRRGSRARKMAGRRVGFLGGGDFAFFNVPSSLFFALAACVLWRRVGASVLMRPPDRAQLDTWSTALLVVVRMCACTVVWDVWVCGMRSTSRSVDLCVLCLCALCCCESPWLRPQRSIRCPVSRTPGVPRVIGSRTKIIIPSFSPPSSCTSA